MMFTLKVPENSSAEDVRLQGYRQTIKHNSILPAGLVAAKGLTAKTGLSERPALLDYEAEGLAMTVAAQEGLVFNVHRWAGLA